MSLIDEALKRARQEAARQQDAEREARYAKVPVFLPPPRPARSWRLPAVVAVCLAVGVAGGVMWRSPHPLSPSPATPPPLPGRGGTPAEVVAPAEPPVVVEEKPEAPATPTPAAPIASPIPEERPESRSPSPGEGARGGGRGGQGVRAPEPEQPAPAVTPTPIPPDPGPVIALPQPSPTPPPPPPAEPQSYVREVPSPGGGTLRLNGIAYSAQQPVALFGDKVVAPGESIEGFTVVAIEAQRVKLQGPGGAVYVTLK